MDDKLVKSLCLVVTEMRKKGIGMSSDIQPTLKAFYNLLSKASDVEINYLKLTYNNELYKIKTFIQKDFRSWHDKIFIKVLKLKRLPQQTTNIFSKFIEGITYFYDELDTTVPLYHRLYSCGPYENTHRLGNLVCYDTLTDEEFKRRKPLIERCYVERLIYDEIYKKECMHFPSSGNVEPSQDDGHLFRLELTKQDYETCFPGCTIDIDIEYMNENYPISLSLTKTHKNGSKILHKWTKSLIASQIIGGPHYERIVQYEITNKRGQKKVESQTFDMTNKHFKLL